MCYAKPGPRCAAHVTKELSKVNEACKKSPNDFNLFAKRKNLQREYDATKKGQADLASSIIFATDNAKREKLSKRLVDAREYHAIMIRAYRDSRRFVNNSKDAPSLAERKQEVADFHKIASPAQFDVLRGIEVEYTFDKVCDDCPDAPCEHDSISNIQMTKFDVREVLGSIFNVSPNQVPSAHIISITSKDMENKIDFIWSKDGDKPVLKPIIDDVTQASLRLSNVMKY